MKRRNGLVAAIVAALWIAGTWAAWAYSDRQDSAVAQMRSPSPLPTLDHGERWDHERPHPTWSPTWEPTWSPSPKPPPVPEPTYTYDAPTIATSSGALSAAQVASYARAAGFPESVIPTMVAIAQRESGLCPTAVYGYGCNSGGTTHGSNACGLWQIYTCPGPQALDPAVNAALAYAKYKAAGYSLSPWSM